MMIKLILSIPVHIVVNIALALMMTGLIAGFAHVGDMILENKSKFNKVMFFVCFALSALVIAGYGELRIHFGN